MPMLEASSAPDSWAAQYGKKSARGIRPRISAAAVTAGLKCAPETCALPETIATSTALTAIGASGLLLAATPRNVNTRKKVPTSSARYARTSLVRRRSRHGWDIATDIGGEP